MVARSGPSLLALVLLGTAGVSIFLAMPVVVAALIDGRHYSNADVGLFSMVELVTISLGCLVSTMLGGRRIRRNGIAALAVIIVVELLTVSGLAGGLFLGARMIGGLAGGIAVSQATGGIARLPRSERCFGLFLATQTIAAIAFLMLIPTLFAHFGVGAVFAPLAAMALVAMIAVVCLLHDQPDDGAGTATPRTRNDGPRWLAVGAILLSIFAFFTGIGTLWTFVAVIGENAGLDAAQIAVALSLSKLVAFLSSFLPGLVRSRFGRLAPMTVAIAALLAAIFVFAHGSGPAGFGIAAALFSFGWYLLYPFQLAFLSELDRDGRAVLGSAALTGAGLGLGPAIVAMLPVARDTAIYGSAATSFAIAFLMVLVVSVLSGRLPRCA